jgi:hypothetical protein
MHGSYKSQVDVFTGNGVGAAIPVTAAANPYVPVTKHIFTQVVSTGTVTGAQMTYDVLLKDGTWVDSGMGPISIAGTATFNSNIEGLVSPQTAQAVRTRVSGWTGGTNATATSRLVDLA